MLVRSWIAGYEQHRSMALDERLLFKVRKPHWRWVSRRCHIIDSVDWLTFLMHYFALDCGDAFSCPLGVAPFVSLLSAVGDTQRIRYWRGGPMHNSLIEYRAWPSKALQMVLARKAQYAYNICDDDGRSVVEVISHLNLWWLHWRATVGTSSPDRSILHDRQFLEDLGVILFRSKKIRWPWNSRMLFLISSHILI